MFTAALIVIAALALLLRMGVAADILELRRTRGIPERLDDQIDARDFGAIGNGVADDTTAIRAAIAAAASKNARLVLDGTFRITGTLDMSGVKKIHATCTIVPDFDGIAVQFVGASGSLIEDIQQTGMMVVSWANLDWSVNRTAFYFQNVYNSEFALSARRCSRGIVCHGLESGVVHNNFKLGAMWQCNVGVWLDAATATGWANHNVFHGGFFYGAAAVAGSIYAAEAGHIYIASAPYACNGNVFLQPSLEWNGASYRLARLGGTRNRLVVGYAEVVGGDTTWIIDTGTKNLIDCMNVPYVIGYDHTLSGANNRVDCSTATEPFVVGTQGYIDLSGEGSQVVRANSATRPALWARQAAAGRAAVRCQNLQSAAEPGLEIVTAADAPGVSIPAAGIWTVFNGTIKVGWNFVAAPATGTWTRGDIAWNVTPSAGGTPGWVCVASGTPGTWKAMANLAP